MSTAVKFYYTFARFLLHSRAIPSTACSFEGDTQKSWVRSRRNGNYMTHFCKPVVNKYSGSSTLCIHTKRKLKNSNGFEDMP